MTGGYLRVAAAVPRVSVAGVDANTRSILEMAGELDAKGVEVAVFPEMCITGYTCADLFHNFTLIDAAADALSDLIDASRRMSVAMIVGLPVRVADGLYNCAAFVEAGRCVLAAKSYIPCYNEFYESRWWRRFDRPEALTVRVGRYDLEVSGPQLIRTHGTTIGIEICEDLWVPVPPSCTMAMAGATVIFNLSASDDLIGKYAYLRNLVISQSARCLAGYVYAGAGYGESSTDLVFDGKALIAENGTLLAERARWDATPGYEIADIDVKALERDRMHMTTFADCAVANRATLPVADFSDCSRSDADAFPSPLLRRVDPHPFVPADDAAIDHRAAEIVNIQSAGLARRLDAIGCRNLVVGISGGLDSTLALLVAVHAFDRLGLDRKGIHGITMPGFGTTDRTHDNAVSLMKLLGVSTREISIVPAVNCHLADIGHDPAIHDVTYENAQARQRTYLLMDIANQVGGIVLGTGDLSELALGWATYNGDHMSMYGVNAGVPKTLVRYLVRWFARREPESEMARVLRDIIDTPISPELIPADEAGNIKQRTEDLVGPYELHDFFLYYMLRYGFAPTRVYRMALCAFDGVYDSAIVLHWLRVFYRRFFAQQFKRSCMPDGPKVGSVCLSPRGDWRMPSDASSALWLKEVDELSAAIAEEADGAQKRR